jgi:MerR HTH family regulatory protein
MNLSIEQLSKLTKLSIPTLRVYVSRQKLGKKVGTKRVFSQSDVQKLLKVAKKSPAEKKPKLPARKTRAAGKSAPVKQPSKVTSARSKVDPVRGKEPSAKAPKASFWTRLFGTRKQKPKVSLMDAKTTR